jgi:hypothetical protein
VRQGDFVPRPRWTNEDERELKAHSQARTPLSVIARKMSRTEGDRFVEKRDFLGSAWDIVAEGPGNNTLHAEFSPYALCRIQERALNASRSTPDAGGFARTKAAAPYSRGDSSCYYAIERDGHVIGTLGVVGKFRKVGRHHRFVAAHGAVWPWALARTTIDPHQWCGKMLEHCVNRHPSGWVRTASSRVRKSKNFWPRR